MFSSLTPDARCIVTEVNNKAVSITVEEYKERLTKRLINEVPTLRNLRSCWVDPRRRRDLMRRLPDDGRAVLLVQKLDGMEDYDLYDVLAQLGYAMIPRTRQSRAEALIHKHQSWLAGMPPDAAATLKAIVTQFAKSGTEALENPLIFDLHEVRRAGGLAALKALGEPAQILREAKERLFTV